MKIRKRSLSLAICAIGIFALGYLLLVRGISFNEDYSPDRRFVLRSYQVFDTWNSVRFVKDFDSAKGYIRLFDSNGKLIDQTSCKALTFLIVNWKSDEVEIQGDEVIHWKLPR